MRKEDFRIIFMGTPDFAVPSLKALIENNFNVVAVITNPDKPAGRGQKIKESPIKEYAKSKNINILQPNKFRDNNFIEELKKLNADLQIVVAFKMLPEIVWSMPKLGTINLHSSLLPNYRGAAPINHAIINGETKTGVSTFFLKHNIDTGNILDQSEVEISKNETAGELHDKLMITGANLLIKTINSIINNKYSLISQDSLIANKSKIFAAPKIFKEDCEINWTKDIDTIHNHIRGLCPYPAAWTTLKSETKKNTKLKIFETEKELKNHNNNCGDILIENDKIKVAVNKGFIIIKSLQQAGKKKLKTVDFLRGFQNISDYKF
ncbi:MAG: methionyl-tRNA formyltransferase [Bacteroidota bacterium]|nr:methionyl-tRNA formyltransferase [Bacteroidota bacterium]